MYTHKENIMEERIKAIEAELKRAESISDRAIERWSKDNKSSRYAVGYADGLRKALKILKGEAR